MGGHRPRPGAPRGGDGIALHAVIPAGGAGTRLWPRSRRARPKHFMSPGGGPSLLVRAYERVRLVTPLVHVLTEAPQAALVAAELPEAALIVEPEARGTTSAYGLAALTLLESDPDAVMVTAPADHLVGDAEAFASTLRLAAGVAQRTSRLVLVGLRPQSAATEYGYIAAGDEVPGEPGVLAVRGFVEKPDRDTASALLAAGDHYWNLAMFAWRASVFVDELGRLSPEHRDGLERVLAARRAGDDSEAARIYSRLPEEAVDYAVMQRAVSLLMVRAEFAWTDVGSWTEMLAGLPEAGANRSAGELVTVDASGCLVDAPGKLVALVGVDDLVVVDTEDALLVCRRDRVQDLKGVVSELGRTGRTGYL